ncbi:hypothetical protein N7466_006705 [Penicillium verhagenii]|uniref:uncharacterized protein n=1 Tax=Penicillium verhagenii TaxID=1562060 RepID=UPI002544FD71|nr:uncharacterized protein N7466_006705 [Penicillium verhagenii]KAJ5927749.1 hypothetical protein N7466_006705 [Penicillium verhagenii]
MVYYFTSNVVSPSAFIYVGKDKFESMQPTTMPEGMRLTVSIDEDLIEFGLDSDFHVDNLSSAHVYVRLREGETWDKIPEELLEDCAQLTKANSIEGNKKDNVTIIYTPWSNLQKDGSMATGQVSFHNPKLVRKVLVRARENPIVNRLNKTRVEKSPDFRAEKEEYLKKKRHAERKTRDQLKEKEKQEKREREQLKWQKDHAYDDIFSEEAMEASSNQDRDPDFLDDFM